MMLRKKNKPRRGSNFQRRTNTREIYRRVLIVCEGEKTELLYFSDFRMPGLRPETSKGGDALKVVEKALKCIQGRRGGFDEIWCVFDRDDTTCERFNEALALAKRNDLWVVYSNPCFEIWYLLHFHYYNTAIARQDCCDKLSEVLQSSYEKNAPGMHARINSKQVDAIRYAKRLLEQYDPPSPADDNPSTTVHNLVERLNDYRRP